MVLKWLRATETSLNANVDKTDKLDRSDRTKMNKT